MYSAGHNCEVASTFFHMFVLRNGKAAMHGHATYIQIMLTVTYILMNPW